MSDEKGLTETEGDLEAQVRFWKADAERQTLRLSKATNALKVILSIVDNAVPGTIVQRDELREIVEAAIE